MIGSQGPLTLWACVGEVTTGGGELEVEKGDKISVVRYKDGAHTKSG